MFECKHKGMGAYSNRCGWCLDEEVMRKTARIRELEEIYQLASDFVKAVLTDDRENQKFVALSKAIDAARDGE